MSHFLNDKHLGYIAATIYAFLHLHDLMKLLNELFKIYNYTHKVHITPIPELVDVFHSTQKMGNTYKQSLALLILCMRFCRV